MAIKDMKEFHAKITKLVENWPDELRVYFVLVCYEKMAKEHRGQLLQHLLQIEEQELLEQIDTEGPMQ